MTTIEEIRQILKETAKAQTRLLETQEKQAKEHEKRWQEEEKRRQERSKEREIAKQRLHRLERIQEIASKKSEEHLEQLKRRMNQFVGGWDNRWGRFIECLVKWSVVRLLKIRGIIIDRVRQRVTDKTRPQPRWEIDVLAENSKLMVAIEAKHYLTKSDVDEAIERFKKFKQDYKDGSGKVLYGGVGYLDCEEKIDKYAERKGLFVFRSVGDSAVIINEETFKPKAL